MASYDERFDTPAHAGIEDLPSKETTIANGGAGCWRVFGPGNRDTRTSISDLSSGGTLVSGAVSLRKFAIALALGLALVSAHAGGSQADDPAPLIDPHSQTDFSILAEQGSADAQYALARQLASDPDGVENHEETFWWLRQAARGGHAGAQNDLGVLYGNGYDRPQDFVEAFMWFEIAASNGNLVAVRNRSAVQTRMTEAEVNAARELARDWQRWHTA